ncbi:MAG: hypothetical protein CK431_04380 [Mycobacterium sp.]|nr:MAG: hypothetical protein CK431_04380 [Mycobacterium sp.]
MIGVAISTHARPRVLTQSLSAWAKYLPNVLVVNHDVAGAGVAATKNRGIAALMDAGCEHLFLADDDIWPVTPQWARPYVRDPQPHLMHCWGKSRLIGDDGHYTTWTHPRGVLLYAHRTVIEAVGGMHLEFGRWGGEHVEWSRRIHAAGLTAHRYADLSAARRGIWHAEDYTRRTPSTVGQAERDASAPLRHELYERFAGSTEFVDYRV